MKHFMRQLAWLGLSFAMTGLPAAVNAQVAAPGPAPVTPKAQASGNWKQLKAREKQALTPLAAQWGELTETQRSKWLAIAQHFDQLTPAEQQVMQTRMTQWVSLNPVQRNQARLNFNTVQSVSKDEKKSRWDEYQNLSEEQKRKLSAGVLTTSKTAAPSPRPSASDRLVQPALRTVPSTVLPARAPIDQKTLLPVPPTETAPAPAIAPSASREGSAS